MKQLSLFVGRREEGSQPAILNALYQAVRLKFSWSAPIVPEGAT